VVCVATRLVHMPRQGSAPATSACEVTADEHGKTFIGSVMCVLQWHAYAVCSRGSDVVPAKVFHSHVHTVCATLHLVRQTMATSDQTQRTVHVVTIEFGQCSSISVQQHVDVMSLLTGKYANCYQKKQARA